MKTWVVDIEPDEAIIFAMPEGDDHLHQVYRHQRKDRKSLRSFLRYLAEEMEIACSAGTDSRFVLLAPPSATRILKRILSPEARARIVENLGEWFVNTWAKARTPKRPILAN